jgi:cellulase/cellobiase CelA1
VELPEDAIDLGGDIESSLTIANSWSSGYCADGLVINHSVNYVKWEVSDTIDGTITNIWNANYRTVGADTVFTGDSWNAELGPGTSTPVGFCETYDKPRRQTF